MPSRCAAVSSASPPRSISARCIPITGRCWTGCPWATSNERLMMNDGSYDSTVLWLAEKLSWESPQEVVMTLREGVTFHDGSPFDAKSVKYQIDWIRNGPYIVEEGSPDNYLKLK